jgi:hypothetical protein
MLEQFPFRFAGMGFLLFGHRLHELHRLEPDSIEKMQFYNVVFISENPHLNGRAGVAKTLSQKA